MTSASALCADISTVVFAIATFKINVCYSFGDEPFVTADMDLSIIGLATKVKMRDSIGSLLLLQKKTHHEFKYNHRS